MGQVERPKVTVGFIPLIDCAPLLFAEVLGLYERHGLEVELRREVSWSNIRDKLAVGLLDAAHMLSPMPLATTLGIDSVNVPMIAAMTLHLNGNSITLSNGLWREIGEAAPEFAGDNLPAGAPLDVRALAAVVARRARDGRPPVTLASVFTYSSHNHLLRLWLASGGIDPDRDVRLTVVPPPHMVAHLSGGTIDGYCVGEPWNQQSASLGIGRIAASSRQIWDSMPDFHIFHRQLANFPWRSHADWFLSQMVRWGQVAPRTDMRAVADRVFRSDIYRAAASELGLPCPLSDRKVEGAHPDPWIIPTNGAPVAMGPDSFLDGSVFDPSKKTSEIYEQQESSHGK